MYGSGSGVYGELGELEVAEDHGPLEPVSTYGASKLAGEALSRAVLLTSSACEAASFRFGNVVGPRQTHGVGFDFISSLRKDPTQAADPGRRFAEQVVRAHLRHRRAVMTGGERSTTSITTCSTSPRAITPPSPRSLRSPCRSSASGPSRCGCEYTGGDRGWKGDVPVVRLSIEKVQRLGWRRDYSSHEALRAAMVAMLDELDAGLL